MTVYSHIIVGAGSAGCVLAKRLSADRRTSVLLIEAGRSDRSYPPIHVPIGYLACIGNERTDWKFATEDEAMLRGRSLPYPRGLGLGGCSSINGMIYMRGQKEDYDGWAEVTGDDGWNWDNMLPLFKLDEDHYRGSSSAGSKYHGTGGCWRVDKQRLSWDALEVFKKAVIESGIPETADFNTGSNYGVSYFDVNQREGWRLNAFQAFVRPALSAGLSNLTVLTNKLVDKLIFDERERNRCVGVEFCAMGRGNGSVSTVENERAYVAAGGEVLLSGGAIGSVQVLERSGVGCAKHLRSVGVPVRADLPAVGENLQDHLQLRAHYKVEGLSTMNSQAHSVTGIFRIGVEYLMNRSGPLSMAPSQLGVFAMSSDHHERPNLQYHIQPLSLNKFGEYLHSYDAITASVCNIRPTSRGSVHIPSSDAMASPSIRPNYLSTSQDQKVAVDALRLTRRIVLNTRALAPYRPTEVTPGEDKQTDHDLLSAAGDIGTTIFHPVGTCRMGRSPTDSVVDARLKVHGFTGLRVADASVMPTITSGNTAAPTMAIAERAASLILRHYSVT